MALHPLPTHFTNPNNPHSFSIFTPKSLSFLHKFEGTNHRFSATLSRDDADNRNSSTSLPSIPYLISPQTLNLRSSLLHLAASAVLFVSLGARACTSGPAPPLPSEHSRHSLVETLGGSDAVHELESENTVKHLPGRTDVNEGIEEKELKAAFENWKSKTYALTVPLRVVSLRGSVPPSWFKDFVQVQGRRLKLQSEFRGRLQDIFSDLCLATKKGRVEPKSAMAADIVTIGDSWLSLAVSGGIIEPIQDADEQDWFKGLNDKWKVYLRRNTKGDQDSDGKIWGAPYRWGSMVIAYKKNKFRKHHLAPIEDWKDLWRPELAGKISMVDSPREVVGAVLKYMGGSYNAKNIDTEVPGGKEFVIQNLGRLQKQVRLFDSVHYLKAFGAGDVWVAVGWSSDVLPAAKRMSNVAVIVPKSGASLWADLWAIPATTKFNSKQIGGRIRSPSPLVHQWIEFCLQAARALPFRQEIIPGASPSALEIFPVEEGSQEMSKGKPKLDTNLIAGIPPPEILAKCEFLEPLSEEALTDYQWLISCMQKPDQGRIKIVLEYISAIIQTFGFRSKANQV